MLPDFSINANNPVSSQFLDRGIHTFLQAANYVKHLPYRRNSAPFPLINVLTEQRGVCSTKHALLKTLACENGHHDIQLVMGIYKMNEWNTHGVGRVLNKYGLEYLPEGHTYLKLKGEIHDFTKSNANLRFAESLLEEIILQPARWANGKLKNTKIIY